MKYRMMYAKAFGEYRAQKCVNEGCQWVSEDWEYIGEWDMNIEIAKAWIQASRMENEINKSIADAVVVEEYSE